MSKTGAHESRPMRVGVVTQYFPPENVPIPAAVADELARRGHAVRVVTGFPNYPAGQLFPGYRQRLGLTEDRGGVRVMRTPVWVSHSRNPVGRMVSYLSFGFSALSASRFLKDADVIYVYATQMTAAIAPLIWRVGGKTPFVLHVQDLWPESITGSGMVGGGASRVIAGALGPWLRATYRRAGAVIGIAPTMTATLVQRGAPAERAHTVFNWAPRTDADYTVRRSDGDRLRLMYAGNIGEMQDLETVLRALALVPELEIELAVFGEGVAEPRIRSLAIDLGLKKVTFHGKVPADEVGRRAAETDFQLVTLKDLAVFRMTIPSKFQSSIAQGVPVITTVAGDLSEIVEQHGVGFTSEPGDPSALAGVLRQAAESTFKARSEMRARARELYEREMTIDAGIGAIERILAGVARPRRYGGRER